MSQESEEIIFHEKIEDHFNNAALTCSLTLMMQQNGGLEV